MWVFMKVNCWGFWAWLNFFILFFSNPANDWVPFSVVRVLQHFATNFYNLIRTLDCVIRLVYFVCMVSFYKSFYSFSLYSVIYIIYTFLLSRFCLRILYYKAIAFIFWNERSFFLIFSMLVIYFRNSDKYSVSFYYFSFWIDF